MSFEPDTGLEIAAYVLAAFVGLILFMFFLIRAVMYGRARLLDSPVMQKETQEDETESDLSEWHAVWIDKQVHNNARNDCSER